MSYQITLDIAEDSELGRLIDDVAAREQLSREEAAFKLSQSNNSINRGSQNRTEQTTEAQRIAAIKSITGSVQGPDWLWQEFEDERRADIERENEGARF